MEIWSAVNEPKHHWGEEVVLPGGFSSGDGSAGAGSSGAGSSGAVSSGAGEMKQRHSVSRIKIK